MSIHQLAIGAAVLLALQVGPMANTKPNAHCRHNAALDTATQSTQQSESRSSSAAS